MKWLQHFVDHVHPSPTRKVVLFLDGHASHKSFDAIEFARANGVELVCFPPHTTHRLQPPDKCYFGPLKTFYRHACDSWMVSHAGKRITFYEIATLFSQAFSRASAVDKGVSGFSSCGLWPFKHSVFSEVDFAPSLMTDNNLEVNPDEDAARTIPLAPVAAKPTCCNAAAAANPVLEEPAPEGTAKSALSSLPAPVLHAANPVPEPAAATHIINNYSLLLSSLPALVLQLRLTITRACSYRH